MPDEIILDDLKIDKLESFSMKMKRKAGIIFISIGLKIITTLFYIPFHLT